MPSRSPATTTSSIAIATRLAEWQAEISAFVSKRGGAYVQVPADLDLADLLFDVLRRRRVVE